MTDPSDMTAVVADIGGTNTRVALAIGTQVQPGTIRRYRNSEHRGIVPVLQAYLAELGQTPDAACVAMAGPVHEGVGTLTNLSWRVDRAEIAQALGVPLVAVLNDLQAQGHALPHLEDDKIDTLKSGIAASPMAARLVIGVGTGLNAALVYRTEHGTLVPPSESGHVSIPVQNADELRLLQFLSRRHGTAGIEEILSGRGVEQIYAWRMAEDGEADLPCPEAATILKAVADGSDPRAEMVAGIFVRMLGRYCGNLTLIQLPFGGVYLCGGVARAFHPHLDRLGFSKAFADKGRFSDFMAQFPVRIVTDDYAALTGSASHLAEIIRHS